MKIATPKQTYSVYLEPGDIKRLEAVAKARDRTPSYMARAAILHQLKAWEEMDNAAQPATTPKTRR